MPNGNGNGNGRVRSRNGKAANGTGKRALVLAGGGITGLTYEIGALRALDDLLVGASVNDFDIYVGTSAGSFVSALLANGVTPTEMALALEGSNRRLRPPTRWTIYRPNARDALVRTLKLPQLLREIAWEVTRHPSRLNPIELIGMLSPLVPAGFFTSSQLVKYLEEMFSSEGLVDDFRLLEKELHIVTCALDSGQRVVFSRYKNEDVPISLALAASSAVPMLFKPVRINGVDYVDGGIKGISAIDVAVARGATLIVIINPVVPVDTRSIAAPEGMRGQIGEHLADTGMRGVWNQVMRGMLHDGMLDHIRLVRDRHPDVDILLIEPRADDEKMFFHELMSFSARLMVLQHGYESVSSGLQDTWGYLRRILPKYGIHISRRVVDRKPVDVPVESVQSGPLLLRLLRQTVFDRRPRVQLVDDVDVA
ncbi:MAG: patatin-like phospholipase family protein [Candidatus Dormibacteraeota bacterium]|nr:patatin-like phospholipase family protein [Candidatus Dormibacteraeota bacterium]MBV9526075.1 patatin-like phospholipase family protein [Candidatus Dormibacteraeota bacterium]